MFPGVYATVLASALYTMNPLVMALGAFMVAVHHRSVLAEEEQMRTAFGREYDEYCRRVGRFA
jgi:protein-S-isoprenylcysteine O-methyltransferase Ste14